MANRGPDAFGGIPVWRYPRFHGVKEDGKVPPKDALLLTVNIYIPGTSDELGNGEEKDFEDTLAQALLENDITATVEIINQEVV